MIYVAVILLVLALLFDLSVWVWLRNNPVPPLAEIPDWRVRPRYSTNYHQAIQGAYATSAMAIIPLGGVSALTAWSPGAVYRVEDPREVQGY